MKKLFLPLLFLLPFAYSCSTARLGNYQLTEADAASAIRQMLILGAQEGNYAGAFSKENILSTLFPESVTKTLNTLNQLGLTGEIDRFTTTLSTAAEKTATRSIPIFVSGVTNMSLTDAMSIVKGTDNAATNYLRRTIGSNLRTAIRPVMEEALNEYKLTQQWESIIKPIRSLSGNRLNLDLPTLMAGAVSEAMFRKMEEKERQVRNDANARTTTLLQKVFYRKW